MLTGPRNMSIVYRGASYHIIPYRRVGGRKAKLDDREWRERRLSWLWSWLTSAAAKAAATAADGAKPQHKTYSDDPLRADSAPAQHRR